MDTFLSPTIYGRETVGRVLFNLISLETRYDSVSKLISFCPFIAIVIFSFRLRVIISIVFLLDPIIWHRDNTWVRGCKKDALIQMRYDFYLSPLGGERRWKNITQR